MTRFLVRLALRQCRYLAAFIAQNADLLSVTERSRFYADADWARGVMLATKSRPQR